MAENKLIAAKNLVRLMELPELVAMRHCVEVHIKKHGGMSALQRQWVRLCIFGCGQKILMVKTAQKSSAYELDQDTLEPTGFMHHCQQPYSETTNARRPY